MAIGKIHAGRVKTGDTVARILHDGKIEKIKIASLLAFEGLKKVEIQEAEAGDIVSIAGFKDVKSAKLSPMPQTSGSAYGCRWNSRRSR